MQVVFKNDWFTGEKRFKKNPDPQFVDDIWDGKLPSTAKVVEGEDTSSAPGYKPEASLKDFDTERMTSDSYAETLNNVNEQFGDNFNLFSTAATKLALDSGVDIEQVVGTGKDGRVTKYDVEEYIGSKQAAHDGKE